MGVKEYSVEQIIAKLRNIEKLTTESMTIRMAAKKGGLTAKTSHRSRIRHGEFREDVAPPLVILEQDNSRLERIFANQDPLSP